MLKLLFAPVLIPAGLAFTLSAALARGKGLSYALAVPSGLGFFYFQASLLRGLVPGLGLLLPQAYFVWPIQALVLFALTLITPVPYIYIHRLTKTPSGQPPILYILGLVFLFIFGGLSLYAANVWVPPLIEASCAKALAGTPENIVSQAAALSEKHLGRTLDFSAPCQALQEGS